MGYHALTTSGATAELKHRNLLKITLNKGSRGYNKNQKAKQEEKKNYPKCFCLSSNKYRLNMKVANLSKLEFKPYMATYIRMLRKNVIGSSV